MKKPGDIPASEITPETTYLNRRAFMRAGIVAGSALATGFVYRRLNRVGSGGAVGRNWQTLFRPPCRRPI